MLSPDPPPPSYDYEDDLDSGLANRDAIELGAISKRKDEIESKNQKGEPNFNLNDMGLRMEHTENRLVKLVDIVDKINQNVTYERERNNDMTSLIERIESLVESKNEHAHILYPRLDIIQKDNGYDKNKTNEIDEMQAQVLPSLKVDLGENREREDNNKNTNEYLHFSKR